MQQAKRCGVRGRLVYPVACRLTLAACILLSGLLAGLVATTARAEIVAVETGPEQPKAVAPVTTTPAPFVLPVFETPAPPHREKALGADAPMPEGVNLDEGERLRIRVGVLAYSPPWYDGAFVDESLQYLRWQLPRYEFVVRYYPPEALRAAIRKREVDVAAASTTFFHAERMPTLRELAAIVSDTASDPSRAAAAAVIVRSDSPLERIEDLKGRRVSVVADEETPGLYEVLYEAAKAGHDADTFLGSLVRRPPLEMKGVIDDVLDGRADAGILRACFLEDLWRAGSVSYQNQIRVLDRRKGDGLVCYHSTDLYPGWTLVSSESLPQRAAREITAELLTKPQNAWGQYWSVSTDHSAVIEMYRTLKLGSFAYLRDWTLERIWREYWPAIVIGFFTLLTLLIHGVVLEKLVRRRTRELERVHAEQAQAQREARELTERLDALERAGAVGQLSSIVAHEMKQPLAVIQNLSRGTLRILEDEAPDLGDAAEAVESINREAERAAGVIDRVRAYGKGHADRERLSLERAVKRCVERFIASGKSRLVEIRFGRLEAGDVFVNPIDLELIVINLLSNAVNAASTRNRPTVEVSVEREPEAKVKSGNVEMAGGSEAPAMMRLSVADNGPALTQAAFDSLGRTVLKSSSKGLGLGLLIVKSLTESYVGRLTFERAANGGTIAVVRLPLAAPSTGASDAETAARSANTYSTIEATQAKDSPT